VKDASGIRLAGLAPSAGARGLVSTAARASTTGEVTNAMVVQPGIGAPPAFAASADFALLQLGRLTAGQASLSGPVLTLTGAAASPEAKLEIERALAGALPAGLRSGNVTIIVRPYWFEAQSDRSGVALTGYVPDQATRGALVAAAEAAGYTGKLRDELQIVGSAPASFGAAARQALGNLLRLDMGSVRVEDQTAILRGMTCRDVIRQEVETGMGAGLPAGFTGSGQVSMRQTGCTNCQLELDDATKGRSVLFAQGTAHFGQDAGSEGVVNEVARVLQACPNARIAVEGHTNFDGERRGFPNRPLSQARAAAVIDALTARGLAPSRFTAVGYGPDRPLIPHGAAGAREQNRRVQFTILSP
jgi:outer membrane protein OmpA-like peptidoglycan-associated protein